MLYLKQQFGSSCEVIEGSFELKYAMDDCMYDENMYFDFILKLDEFKSICRSVMRPCNPFQIKTKPLQLIQYVYMLQTPQAAMTGDVMKLLKAVRSMILFITHKNGQFCGDILTNPKGWRKYSAYNEAIGQFEFIPHMFIEPLLQQLELRRLVSQPP